MGIFDGIHSTIKKKIHIKGNFKNLKKHYKRCLSFFNPPVIGCIHWLKVKVLLVLKGEVTHSWF